MLKMMALNLYVDGLLKNFMQTCNIQ